MSAVFDRALTVLAEELTRRKFAATGRPRILGEVIDDGRHVPAHVRRAVWKRDSGRCTFVGTHGHRCNARRRLEFHHVKPFAEGGRATVDNIRLVCSLCRARHKLHYADSRIMPSEVITTASVTADRYCQSA